MYLYLLFAAYAIYSFYIVYKINITLGKKYSATSIIEVWFAGDLSKVDRLALRNYILQIIIGLFIFGMLAFIYFMSIAEY